MAITPYGISFDLNNLQGGVNFGLDPSRPILTEGTQQILEVDKAVPTEALTNTPTVGQQALGGAAIGLAIGQAIGSIYSAWQSGKTMKYVAKQKAAIAEENRQMAQLSAESAYLQGQGKIAQLTYRAGQIKAKQRAAFAANGVVLGQGSTAETTASTDLMKEMDMNTAKLNAMASAWGYKQQALQANAMGGVYQATAGALAQAEMAKGFSSMLEHGSMAADRWYRFYGKQ